jgi:FHS family L-fucose permease-like MFS transporter
MLVAAISGGAAFPPMTGAVTTKTGNFHTAMAIPTAFYVLAWVFPCMPTLSAGHCLMGTK